MSSYDARPYSEYIAGVCRAMSGASEIYRESIGTAQGYDSFEMISYQSSRHHSG